MPNSKSDENEAPTAFISYAWESEAHKDWVRQLAARLRTDGVDVKLDQWEVVPGDQIPVFMETAIRKNTFVLIVCTPRYKVKSDERDGGVGYEGDIMTAEVVASKNHRKFIPLLRVPPWDRAAPTWLLGKYRIDFVGDPHSPTAYDELLDTLLGRRPIAPPLGSSSEKKARSTTATAAAARPIGGAVVIDEAIAIVGIVEAGVTSPRNDGTRGSGLHKVPIRLSRRPSSLWAQLFPKHWDSPSEFTSMHRPGIARISGDLILLDGTTLDEIERYHKKTLKLAVDAANEEEEKLLEQKRHRDDAERRRMEEHKREVANKARDIDFSS